MANRRRQRWRVEIRGQSARSTAIQIAEMTVATSVKCHEPKLGHTEPFAVMCIIDKVMIQGSRFGLGRARYIFIEDIPKSKCRGGATTFASMVTERAV